MSGFANAMEWLLKAEGGFVVDQGGPTFQGVTSKVYDAWRDKRSLPRRDVRQMQPDERDSIYHAEYWLASKCDALPWPASLIHFDAAVNSGPRQAVILLQRALGVVVDGNFGPETARTASAVPRHILLNNMLWERAEFFAALAEKPRHKASFRGWINRVLALRRRVRGG